MDVGCVVDCFDVVVISEVVSVVVLAVDSVTVDCVCVVGRIVDIVDCSVDIVGLLVVVDWTIVAVVDGFTGVVELAMVDDINVVCWLVVADWTVEAVDGLTGVVELAICPVGVMCVEELVVAFEVGAFDSIANCVVGLTVENSLVIIDLIVVGTGDVFLIEVTPYDDDITVDADVTETGTGVVLTVKRVDV